MLEVTALASIVLLAGCGNTKEDKEARGGSRASGASGATDSSGTPRVTATEIKIGQSMPCSGPASAFSVIGTGEAAYFKMINDKGGINGRKEKPVPG